MKPSIHLSQRLRRCIATFSKDEPSAGIGAGRHNTRGELQAVTGRSCGSGDAELFSFVAGCTINNEGSTDSSEGQTFEKNPKSTSDAKTEFSASVKDNAKDVGVDKNRSDQRQESNFREPDRRNGKHGRR